METSGLIGRIARQATHRRNIQVCIEIDACATRGIEEPWISVLALNAIERQMSL